MLLCHVRYLEDLAFLKTCLIDQIRLLAYTDYPQHSQLTTQHFWVGREQSESTSVPIATPSHTVATTRESNLPSRLQARADNDAVSIEQQEAAVRVRLMRRYDWTLAQLQSVAEKAHLIDMVTGTEGESTTQSKQQRLSVPL